MPNPNTGIGKVSERSVAAQISTNGCPRNMLIAAWAGFVSRVVDELLKAGYAARVLDNLAPQVQTLASIFRTRYIL
jgi:hypothetical protein